MTRRSAPQFVLKDVDEGRFRAICQTALEGLAAKRLNLDMLVEPAARPWREVRKVAHYRLDVDALTQPMEVRDDRGDHIAEDGP